MEEFGKKIIELRRMQNWSQEQLADRLNVSRQTVSKWETNQAVPSPANVRALCEAFGVSLNYFLSEETTEASKMPETSSVNGMAEQLNEKQKREFRLALHIFLIIFLTIAAMILGVVVVGACCIIFDPNRESSSAVATQTYPEWYVLIGAAIALAALLYWLIFLIVTRIKYRRKKKK